MNSVHKWFQQFGVRPVHPASWQMDDVADGCLLGTPQTLTPMSCRHADTRLWWYPAVPFRAASGNESTVLNHNYRPTPRHAVWRFCHKFPVKIDFSIRCSLHVVGLLADR